AGDGRRRPGGLAGQARHEVLRIVGVALTNARRHSGARNVRVAVSGSDHHVVVAVSDDGEGFSVATPPRAPSRTGIKGMRERAGLLGGELAIHSEPGAGTTVRVRVALGDDREELPAPHVRVLLVEDHAAVREAIAVAFERETGFEVVGQAGSLTEARTMLSGVDVAVLDLGLPDGDGIDLIPELRERNDDALALVLSASLDPAVMARAMEHGAAAALDKMAQLAEVVETVRGLRAGRRTPT
ncbi:MAG: hypothetical protein QOF29_3992, partial [bacterium]